MKLFTNHIEQYRMRAGPFGSDSTYGMNGVFQIPLPSKDVCIVIVSDGGGWEHVSISLSNRCLTWDEMCFIKDLFWTEDEAVFQIHPAKKNYVNNHPYCLHLWRPADGKFPMPPAVMVGEK